MKLEDIVTPEAQKTDLQPKPEGNVPEGQPNVDQPDSGSQQPQTDDLLSRVTKFVEKENPVNKSEEQIDADIYNDAEFRQKIEAVQDPELKEYLVQLRKSGVRGVNEKLTEIAEIRKEIQALKGDIQPKGWTPERIQSLINDPEFLQAAQQVAGTTTQDDEYVPESVKAKLAEVDKIKSQLQAWQQSQVKQNIEQQHEVLSKKYANYNKQNVDTIYKEVLEGKRAPNPEDIYKVVSYEDNIKNAYALGRKDALSGVSEKERVSTIEGTTQVRNSEIKPEKDESNKKLWSRIIETRLSSQKK